MVYYRRDYTPGATYFFTLTLRDRKSSYLTSYIQLLGYEFRRAREQAYFTTHAITVLPEHLHVIWELPENDCNFSHRWRMIKGNFTKELLKLEISLLRNKRGEYNVWQNRFWEHRIRDEYDFQKHCDCIHYNPVKHGYVLDPIHWPYSSIHQFIAQDILPKNWGGTSTGGVFGE